jgi:hypothetical protein
MNTAAARLLSTASLGGVQIVMLDKAAAAQARTQCLELAASLGLAEILMTDIYGSRGVTTLLLRLQPEVLRAWMPDHDTAQLHRHLGHDPQSDDARALDREIFVSLLAAPLPHVFVDVAGLASAIRVRRHITLASRRTALAFKTSAAERPEQYWRYDEDHGFILQPGADLIEALTAATQPEATGKVYDSCWDWRSNCASTIPSSSINSSGTTSGTRSAQACFMRSTWSSTGSRGRCRCATTSPAIGFGSGTPIRIPPTPPVSRAPG